MDKATVFGTVDGSSILSEGTNRKRQEKSSACDNSKIALCADASINQPDFEINYGR